MAQIPENVLDSKTVCAIYAAYERTAENRLSRRLGASQIGKECDRAIWYDFRWSGVEEKTGRMLRLLETGNLEEPRFVRDLQRIGCEVQDRNPETKEQWEFSGVDGHLVCKLDAAALGIPEAPKTWHAVSMKTASEKSFKEIKAKGVQKAKPEHYAQCCVELALSGLKRHLYIVRNKNTDELYAERFRWEEVRSDAEKLLERAKRIVDLKRPPDRIADAEDFKCKWCQHHDRCHGSQPPSVALPVLVTCRSCIHATPEHDCDFGRWSCSRHNKTLSEQEQRQACPEHLFIPDFITFAEATDSGQSPEGDWIEYTNPDGRVWYQSRVPPGFSSRELTLLPSPLITDPTVCEIKESFEAVVVEGV